MRKLKISIIAILLIILSIFGLSHGSVKADDLKTKQVGLAKNIIKSIKYREEIKTELEIMENKEQSSTDNLNIDLTLEKTFQKTLENLEIEIIKNKMELQLVSQQLLSVGESAKLPYLGDGSYTWPVDGYFNVSQGYNGGSHKGVDINTMGAHPKVFAVQTGLVISAKNEEDGFGNKVVIYHGMGVYTLYAHLNKILVQPGAYIEEGATIGTVGHTGDSDGDHLHIQLTIKGDVEKLTMNPLEYIKLVEKKKIG